MWHSSWLQRYADKLFVSDLLIVVFCVALTQLLRFDVAVSELHVESAQIRSFGADYTFLSIILALTWLGLLSLLDTRDRKIIGFGPDEYRRVFQATAGTFAGFAIFAFATQLGYGRGYLFIAFPVGVVLLVLNRFLWRRRLHRHRKQNTHNYRTLIIGDSSKARHVAMQLSSRPYLGFSLVGAVTEGNKAVGGSDPIPTLGGYPEILQAVDANNVQVVVLTDAAALSPQRIRELGWELESRRISLIVATALTDIAGPRLHSRPVGGLPLTFVDYPEFTRFKKLSKRLFDVFTSALIIILISPVLAVLAYGVKRTSEGPVIFKQERVGINGERFHMLKFRSMVVNAEALLPDLLKQQEAAQKAHQEQLVGVTTNTVLFKMKEDPRITNIGRVMRKYSLDELPQLFNVLRGDMSLVGPRPPLPREVEQYGIWDHRRLLVRPGITGLWQTSGRSNLSWEESIRLDLYYVENWSFIGDLIILVRTVKTVLTSEGAY